MGYSSWGCKELDMTERLHFLSLFFFIHLFIYLLTYLDIYISSMHLICHLSLSINIGSIYLSMCLSSTYLSSIFMYPLSILHVIYHYLLILTTSIYPSIY